MKYQLPKNYRNTQCDSEDDEDDITSKLFRQAHLPFFQNTQQIRYIKAYIDEEIREPKYYRPLIQAIETMSEHDGIQLSVNSYGGRLDGAIALINAIQSTEGSVQVCIDGVAASAASLIALAAPNLAVGPYASMMIHAATFGSFGKQSNVISHASFIDKTVKNLMKEVYQDFLTEDEFEQVMMGKEIWLTSDEIIERLELREKLVEQRVNAELAAMESQVTKPKRPRKAKSED